MHEKTEKEGENILLKKPGYVKLSSKEKDNLLLAFIKKCVPVHKKAFDLVRTTSKINFSDENDITRKIRDITLIEINFFAPSPSTTICFDKFKHNLCKAFSKSNNLGSRTL